MKLAKGKEEVRIETQKERMKSGTIIQRLTYFERTNFFRAVTTITSQAYPPIVIALTYIISETSAVPAALVIALGVYTEVWVKRKGHNTHHYICNH